MKAQLVLSLTILGCSVSSVVWQSLEELRRDQELRRDVHSERLQRMRREMVELRRQIAAVGRLQTAATATVPMVSDHAQSPLEGSARDDLEDRVDALERVVITGEDANLRIAIERDVWRKIPGDIAENSATFYQSCVLDKELGLRDRIQALLMLRLLPIPDARSPEVIYAMLEELSLQPDANLRRDILTHLSRADFVDRKWVYLYYMQHDSDRNVRRVAAEEMGHFLKDPTVHEALRFAARIDPSHRVRLAAQRALDGFLPGFGHDRK